MTDKPTPPKSACPTGRICSRSQQAIATTKQVYQRFARTSLNGCAIQLRCFAAALITSIVDQIMRLSILPPSVRSST